MFCGDVCAQNDKGCRLKHDKCELSGKLSVEIEVCLDISVTITHVYS